jgi:hypothetical protein
MAVPYGRVRASRVANRSASEAMTDGLLFVIDGAVVSSFGIGVVMDSNPLVGFIPAIPTFAVPL